MRTFRAVVAYDGREFHGWQQQPGMRTVQGLLEETLSNVLSDRELQVAGAGRTDAGVHARGQVASFRSVSRLPARAIAPLANRALPDDVRLREVGEAADGFHARHSARARRYAYRLLDRDDVLLGRHAWWPRRRPDPDRLARATAVLEREADFSSFRATGGASGTPVCRVMRASWRRDGPFLTFDVMADHFLYRMVRTIVGTALAAADADDPAAEMGAVLEACDRRRAGRTAPPQGLCLEQVYYEGDPA